MAKQVDKKLANALQDEGYFILDKKTIKYGLGILGFLLLGLWGYLQYGISKNATNNINAKTELSTSIKEVNTNLVILIEKLEERKVDPIKEEVMEIKGDVKVILDRTNSRNNQNNNHNNVLPTTNAPTTNSSVNTNLPNLPQNP